MSDWTEGYVADIGYTYGYYAELNPLRIKLAFLSAGMVFPEAGTACELGFGQGVSVNAHAAATMTRWHGTDFNPAQAGYAQELAAACGSGAQLYDEAFDSFCLREDLPDFDYIGLHGIWSWISNENRRVICDFIRRKLKVGGVLYISYNTQPGWAAMAPLRDLLTEHADLMGAPGNGLVPRIDASLEFAQKVLATNSAFARSNPTVEKRLEQIKLHNRNYLAHEYFNRDWLPMSFSHMKRWLEEAKLSFACSASYFDHIEPINLTTEQRELLAGIPDRMFRETVRDFLTNQQFRRDYWVRGARAMPLLERTEAIRAQRVVLAVPRGGVDFKLKAGIGEVTLQEEIYSPILNLLADHRPRSILEIEQGTRQTFGQLFQAIMVLVGMGALYPVQDDAAADAVAERALALNRKLCSSSRAQVTTAVLVSPLTGGGLTVNRFEQLFLLARDTGLADPADWAQYVLSLLQQQGQFVVKEGKTLQSNEEQLQELTTQAVNFKETRLPIMRALRICA